MATQPSAIIKHLIKWRKVTEVEHTQQLLDLDYNAETLYLGDSYFHRLMWNEDLKEYKQRLQQKRVAILAKGGDKIGHLAWRLNATEHCMFPNLKKVVLFIGLNNLSDKDYLSIPNNIAILVEYLTIRFPDVKISVLPLPMFPEAVAQNWNKDIDDLNTKLKSLLEGQPNVSILNPWVEYNPANFEDKIHLNRRGYGYFIENLLKGTT
jgi:hypothetical protein